MSWTTIASLFLLICAADDPILLPPAQAGTFPLSPEELARQQRAENKRDAQHAKIIADLEAQIARRQKEGADLEAESLRLQQEAKTLAAYSDFKYAVYRVLDRCDTSTRRYAGLKLPMPGFLFVPLTELPANR